MSPTPATFASPIKPSSWSWEATNEEISARYGVPIERIVRFDTNTSPMPPASVAAILAAGHWDVPVSEYPPSDYARLVEAAAARYLVARDELLVGAGADEILDLVAKACLLPGGAAVVPVPTYGMYRILTEQRGARVIRVPRLGAAEGYALDVEAVRRAALDAQLVWLCSPNNPTGEPEPAGVIPALLEALAADALAAGREAPAVLLDEAYQEFGSDSHLSLRTAYPRLIVARTMSKAYGIAGLRVGFAVAPRETIAEIEIYRPPGSVSVVSIGVATALLRDDALLAQRVAATVAERSRLTAGLSSAGWHVHRSATNFVLVELDSPWEADAVAEALLARGLIPRTFPDGHPLAHCLRLTVRDTAQDDRLIEAARAVGRPGAPV
ncbi:MAG: histidinol-phosphate aminotransferase family protein [Chloroflexi bacterium]|nr:histidinol-phosphate aminotransferase family protein [Chloroflexota bacterium]